MRHVLQTSVQLAMIPLVCVLATVIAVAPPTGAQQKAPSLVYIKRFSSDIKATDVVPVQRLIPQMHWGAKDSSGLQLGAYYDPQRREILCLIRNAGVRAVTMNAYQFGCGGYIKVYARIAGTARWTEVNDGVCAHGAGPSARDNVIVQPEQYLIGTNLSFDSDAQHRTVTQVECSFTVIAAGVLTRLPNPDRKPVEFRVEHNLPNDGSADVWKGTLSSAALTVPAKSLPAQPAAASADRQ